MQIAKLDLLCLGKANIIKLLDKLDKSVSVFTFYRFLGHFIEELMVKTNEIQHIEGLRLQYNSITEESIKDILPTLSQLRNLRALDLSCNLIDFRQNVDSSRLMAAAFANLAQLSRLDLSGSPLGGCLSTLLTSLSLPLQ